MCIDNVCVESAGGVAQAVCESACTAPPTFECIDGQCTEVASGQPGVNQTVCESLCKPEFYQCVSNKCVQASTGASQATCESVCGPFLRGAVEPRASAVALE